MDSNSTDLKFTQLARQILNELPAKINQVKDLVAIIQWADKKYYIESQSPLSDFEYDTLFKTLKEIAADTPQLEQPDWPTRRVAKGLSEKFKQASHLVPMLSLDNTYNKEDLLDWDKRVRDALPNADLIEYCVEPKYDGASISLIYENNGLQRGTTRGDGTVGEEITQNVLQIKSLPIGVTLTQSGIQQIELRGEVVITKHDFETYNNQRLEEGLALLANPRNAASGTLRMLDPLEVAKRKLSAMMYHISYVHPAETLPNTHYQCIQWLSEKGFPTPIQHLKLFQTIEEVIQFCSDFEQERDKLPFEIDGLVIKVNQLALQDQLGMTTHHPRWAVAYKFKARQATSKLLRVEYQVGRTGTITPVAKIDPVFLGGVTISSISLFNEEVIKEKDLKIGDVVIVERAGDVIPYIAKPIVELRNGTEKTIVFPNQCPICAQNLEKSEEEAAWRCVNYYCEAQVIERLIHFASKDAMDIRSLGESNIRKFFEAGLIKNIPDIYQMNWGKVKDWSGFGAKSITNLQEAIENSKQQPLYRLIFGLGIRHVGETMAKTLANAVTHIHEFYDWTEPQFLALNDVGPKVAASMMQFFADQNAKETINLLAQEGVNLINQKKEENTTQGFLNGKTFLFTGTLTAFKRSAAEAQVEALGGVLLSGVSTKLNYLIVGTDAGSKLEKAKKLNTVHILNETEFVQLIDSYNSK